MTQPRQSAVNHRDRLTPFFSANLVLVVSHHIALLSESLSAVFAEKVTSLKMSPQMLLDGELIVSDARTHQALEH